MRKSLLQGSLVPMVLALAACGGDASHAGTTASATGPAADARAFATCAGCHTHAAGAPHRFGPNLHGVLGRKAGSASGFAYSPALRDSGIVWNAQNLDQYLAAPTRVVPGTRMTVAITDAAQRRAIIRFLSAPPR